jgi:hypothetical protein
VDHGLELWFDSLHAITQFFEPFCADSGCFRRSWVLELDQVPCFSRTNPCNLYLFGCVGIREGASDVSDGGIGGKVPFEGAVGALVSSALNCVMMRRLLGSLLDFSVLVVRERVKLVPDSTVLWLATTDAHDGSDAE